MVLISPSLGSTQLGEPAACLGFRLPDFELVTVVPAHTPDLGGTGPRHADGGEGGGESEDGE